VVVVVPSEWVSGWEEVVVVVSVVVAAVAAGERVGGWVGRWAVVLYIAAAAAVFYK
jgi:hypothetical protein